MGGPGLSLNSCCVSTMPPGGGVGITSINRETSLPDLIGEIRKRHAAGPVCLGKASMVSQKMANQRDAAQRKAKPNLFFDSYRHIDRVRDNLAQDPEFSCKLKPSMSAPSVSQIAASCAGTSTYIELL